MNQDYVPPSLGSDGFHCPACGTYSLQRWHSAYLKAESAHAIGTRTPAKPHFISFEKVGLEVANVFVSRCDRCQELAVWLNEHIVWPMGGIAPPPNADLPDDVRSVYIEASAIANTSPRGGAALLRVAIEKLCKALVPGKKPLNDAIAVLVSKGLNVQVQQALDVVRVIGNSAVHPGQIDLNDDAETAAALFGLVNLIADAMITQPKLVQTMYDALPANQRASIEKRDGKSPGE